jgi:hypothetical protein
VFMDDWIGHVGEEIMDFLREARVVLTTWLLHMTQIFL